MKKLLFVFTGLLLVIVFTSCLTVERKDYSFKFAAKEGGEMTIVFYNILSSSEDGKDMSTKDFNDLINNYYKGTKIQDEYPTCKIIKKELYDDNGVLSAKIILKFNKMADVKLYQHQNKGSIMLYISSIYETYDKSNGQYGGDIMPVIFWKKSKKLTLTTKVQEPSKKTVSLLEKFKAWQEINEPYKAK